MLILDVYFALCVLWTDTNIYISVSISINIKMNLNCEHGCAAVQKCSKRGRRLCIQNAPTGRFYSPPSRIRCDKLTRLDVNACDQLEIITSLPKTLKTLWVSSCNHLKSIIFDCRDSPASSSLLHLILQELPALTTLPMLPAKLEYCECYHCPELRSLLSLPSSSQLKELHLHRADMDWRFLAAVPDTLRILSLAGSTITSLYPLPWAKSLDVRAEPLPEAHQLKHLNLSDTKIAILPVLPNTVECINCNFCPQLKEISGPLPSSLIRLECCYCPQLGPTLPSFPTTLEKLYCTYCPQLISIPRLPRSWQVADCTGCTKLMRITGVLTSGEASASRFLSIVRTPLSQSERIVRLRQEYRFCVWNRFHLAAIDIGRWWRRRVQIARQDLHLLVTLELCVWTSRGLSLHDVINIIMRYLNPFLWRKKMQ